MLVIRSTIVMRFFSGLQRIPGIFVEDVVVEAVFCDATEAVVSVPDPLAGALARGASVCKGPRGLGSNSIFKR